MHIYQHYFKCKWIKCYNQKTLAEQNKTLTYDMLSTEIPLRSKDTRKKWRDGSSSHLEA